MRIPGPVGEKMKGCAAVVSICGIIVYGIITLGFLLTFGGVLIRQGNIIEDASSQDTAYLKQLVTDWMDPPYAAITIE